MLQKRSLWSEARCEDERATRLLSLSLSQVQHKRFWSESYGRFLRFRVTTAVIKQAPAAAAGGDHLTPLKHTHHVTPRR